MRPQRAAMPGSWVMSIKVVPPSGTECEEQIHHAAASFDVKTAGRFIRQQQARPRREGSGDRHALLLAAGELSRSMM